ncbi:coiled-coil domain-containing protein 92-like [Ptychodera flava]|uniref:coiled-coil domain-containing protein 92-like n=1 Tax=Ptychodera flava TaxID=63121 RepID=UPI003969EDEF
MTSAEVQLRNAESAILFMQQEHAKTLQGLHTEIQKLQKKCSELTFELAMKTTTTVDEEYYMKKIKSLETELKVKNDKSDETDKEIDKRDKRLHLLEQQLRAQERKYRDELKLKSQKIHSLSGELDSKSATIAYLTAALHKEKQKYKAREEQNMEKYGSKTAMNPLPPQEPVSGSARRRSQLRKSATSPVQYDAATGSFNVHPPTVPASVSEGRIKSGGRKPQVFRAVSPAMSDTPDPAPFLAAREPSDEEIRVEVKPSPPVLPPIHAQEMHSQKMNAKHSSLARRHYRLANKKGNGQAEVNTLAIDKIAPSEPEYRQLEKSHTD